MNQKVDLEGIYQYWKENAIKYRQSPSASWSDEHMIHMEIAQLRKYITMGDKVLDVGCNNGYSTVRLAEGNNISIKGIDYVEELVNEAKLRLKEDGLRFGKGSIYFDMGNIMRLDEVDNAYDKLVVTRVLINLGNWENQCAALKECYRVLKPGGLLLLSEAVLQGWENVNRFRREWGMKDIAMPVFNQYLDQDKLLAYCGDFFDLELVNDFSSTYYIGTRIVKPLLAKLLGDESKVANPDMEINRFCAQLPSWGDYGIQRLFILKKR